MLYVNVTQDTTSSQRYLITLNVLFGMTLFLIMLDDNLLEYLYVILITDS